MRFKSPDATRGACLQNSAELIDASSLKVFGLMLKTSLMNLHFESPLQARVLPLKVGERACEAICGRRTELLEAWRAVRDPKPPDARFGNMP